MLLKGKRSHEPSPGSPQGWVQPAPLALALLLGAARSCPAWSPGTQAEGHPHTVPATAPPALGSPHLHLKTRHDLDQTARVLPLIWGLWLQSWSPGPQWV